MRAPPPTYAVPRINPWVGVVSPGAAGWLLATGSGLASQLRVDDENHVFFERDTAAVRENDPGAGFVEGDDTVAIHQGGARFA